MKALLTLMLACAPMLGGCANAFEITAVMIDGRLAFVDRGAPSRCVTFVRVTKHPDAQAPDEADEAWRERTMAWVDHGSFGCEDRLPLFYGAPLTGNAGSRLDGEFGPRPLETGVVYTVTIGSGEIDEAGARFRMRSDGRVENLGPVSVNGG